MKLKISAFFVLGIALYLLVTAEPAWEAGLRFLFPDIAAVLHPRAALPVMFAEHLAMTGAAAFIMAALGVFLGIVFTRPAFSVLNPFVRSLAALSQTVPPVAVLALSVPFLGYGYYPVITALVLYGILPVLSGVFSGMDSVPGQIREAARGMGMNGIQILVLVELRLAFPYILAGIRTAVSVSVGTAMIGALTGAGGLGSALSAGLARDNPAFVLEGVIPAVFLALYIDAGLGFLERLSVPPGNRSRDGE